MPKLELHIRVVAMHDADGWTLVCLDTGQAASGPTLEIAHESLARCLEMMVYVDLREGRAPFSRTKPAHKRYWDLASSGRPQKAPVEKAQDAKHPFRLVAEMSVAA